MKMFHECLATMFYGPSGKQNLMVAFIFKFGMTKRHCPAKLDETWSNFSNSKFFYKNMPILSSFVPGFQKCDLFYI